MRSALTIAALTAVISMTACVPSLQPLYTTQDLVFEPALVGTWVAEDDNNDQTKWIVGRSGDHYWLVALETKHAQRFEAHLLKLDRFWFLDIRPEEGDSRSDLAQLLTLRAHLFARLNIEGDQLTVALMDPEWLKQGLRSGSLSISHQRRDEREILVTAPTEELQDFVLRHAADDGAFPDPEVFRRER